MVLQALGSRNNTYFEWEGYDGWYNNPAHPDWGGAGMWACAYATSTYVVPLYRQCSPATCTSNVFLHTDMPMERKTPVAYPDGVYEIAGQDRPNVMLIANITQNGLTGFASVERTALFIFFGMC